MHVHASSSTVTADVCKACFYPLVRQEHPRHSDTMFTPHLQNKAVAAGLIRIAPACIAATTLLARCLGAAAAQFRLGRHQAVVCAAGLHPAGRCDSDFVSHPGL